MITVREVHLHVLATRCQATPNNVPRVHPVSAIPLMNTWGGQSFAHALKNSRECMSSSSVSFIRIFMTSKATTV